MITPSASKLFLLDSSGWIEHLGDGPKAREFAPYLEHEESLRVPTIVVYEVYKKSLRESSKTTADRFLSQAFRAKEAVVDAPIAVAAARASLEHRLALADAIVFATARMFEAEPVTSDTHFRGLPGVTLI